jgi:hypothetical protein
LALGAGMAVAPVAGAQVFSYAGAEQSYLVPSGVTTVHVVAVGAPGGGGTQITGGRGAVVSADLPIPQGQTVLYVEVGGTGAGFNGGGAPNGGDASDVRLLPRAAADSINSRVLVAAGGGGDGNYAGGDAGSDGGGGGMGGKAGTATAGGAGGQGNPPETCTNGQAGSLGQGGSGGAASGGGGGGYYGGGSGGLIGGPNCGPGSYETPGGGGGGGSSYASPHATNVTFGLDNARTPQITITPVVAQVVIPPKPVALSGLSVNPQRFALGGRRVGERCLATTAANRTKPRCTRAIALRVSYRLSGPATVSFVVKQALAGRLVGGRCRAATHANRRHHRCPLVAQRGTFTRAGADGQNAVAFNGRLGNRLLGSGSYVLTATVAGSSGSTGTRSVSFRITS